MPYNHFDREKDGDRSETTTVVRSINPFAPKPGWKPVFLEALANTGNVRAAATAANINRSSARVAYENDLEFRKAYDEALEQAVDLLEYVAWQRATTISDSLLMFLLKGNRPDKYRENSSVQITGANGGPVQVMEISDDERVARLDSLYDRIRERRTGSDPGDGDGTDAVVDQGVEFDYSPGR